MVTTLSRRFVMTLLAGALVACQFTPPLQSSSVPPPAMTLEHSESWWLDLFAQSGASSTAFKITAVTDPNISDIQQGQRAVCYFLAALGSLAYHRPQEVQRLVKQNSNGTYTVTFPGLPSSKNVITVAAPTAIELSTYVLPGKNGTTWVAAVIKAIAQYWSKHGLLRLFRNSDNAANYGGTWEGIEVITGHTADSDLLAWHTHAGLLNKIQKALAEKRLVVTSTFRKGNEHPKVGEIKISDVHVYTVLKVDPSRQTITLRDPYGSIWWQQAGGVLYKDRSTDGVLTFTVNDYRRYFTDLALETNRSVTFLNRLRFLK